MAKECVYEWVTGKGMGNRIVGIVLRAVMDLMGLLLGNMRTMRFLHNLLCCIEKINSNQPYNSDKGSKLEEFNQGCKIGECSCDEEGQGHF